MNKRVAFATLLATLFAGCASTSGVHPTGPSSFTISTQASPGRGGVPAAKRMAYEEATATCANQKRQLQVTDEETTSPTWTEGMASARLNFRCGPPL